MSIDKRNRRGRKEDEIKKDCVCVCEKLEVGDRFEKILRRRDKECGTEGNGVLNSISKPREGAK